MIFMIVYVYLLEQQQQQQQQHVWNKDIRAPTFPQTPFWR